MPVIGSAFTAALRHRRPPGRHGGFLIDSELPGQWRGVGALSQARTSRPGWRKGPRLVRDRQGWPGCLRGGPVTAATTPPAPWSRPPDDLQRPMPPGRLAASVRVACHPPIGLMARRRLCGRRDVYGGFEDRLMVWDAGWTSVNALVGRGGLWSSAFSGRSSCVPPPARSIWARHASATSSRFWPPKPAGSSLSARSSSGSGGRTRRQGRGPPYASTFPTSARSSARPTPRATGPRPWSAGPAVTCWTSKPTGSTCTGSAVWWSGPAIPGAPMMSGPRCCARPSTCRTASRWLICPAAGSSGPGWRGRGSTSTPRWPGPGRRFPAGPAAQPSDCSPTWPTSIRSTSPWPPR